jgi:hypothetical protein
MLMNTAMVRNLLGAAIAAAGVTLAGTSHGAIFNSHFDPNSFVGDGQFQIDDACLAEDGFYLGSNCGATLLSATASITHVDDSDPENPVVLGTAQVNFGSLLPSDPGVVLEIEILDGTLVGVDTDWIGQAFASTCTGDLCGTVPWWIRWVNPDSDPVELATGTCDGIRSCNMNSGEPFATANIVTFTRVPEPGTLALVTGGLLLAWRSRRRDARMRG